MHAIGAEIGQEVRFTFISGFPAMLGSVERGAVDGAIANISITADREAVMDFSRPIFQSGLQMMIYGTPGQTSVFSVLLRRDFVYLALGGVALLFGLGMLMWAAERRKQPYFDVEARQALFPAFWWALNLVVNGGFEQNVPRSVLGRLLSVAMVFSSLFIVSLFVANITAALTVDAITGTIQSIEDLDGRRVGTTSGSTSAALLDERGVSHGEFSSFAALIRTFEAGALEAVVFDGPLLAHYLNANATVDAYLIDRVFRPEDYGIALPQGSPLREPINRALLRLEESGAYGEIYRAWFGTRG